MRAEAKKRKADVFPAPAGMNRNKKGGLTRRLSIPRTRGDEPKPYPDELVVSAYSPHPRG